MAVRAAPSFPTHNLSRPPGHESHCSASPGLNASLRCVLRRTRHPLRYKSKMSEAALADLEPWGLRRRARRAPRPASHSRTEQGPPPPTLSMGAFVTKGSRSAKFLLRAGCHPITSLSGRLPRLKYFTTGNQENSRLRCRVRPTVCNHSLS